MERRNVTKEKTKQSKRAPIPFDEVAKRLLSTPPTPVRKPPKKRVKPR